MIMGGLNMSDLCVKDCFPSIDEFNKLRVAIGWEKIDQALLSVALSNTLYAVSVELDGQVVGSGRVIGDRALYFYIQDVIVLPDFHGLGIGKTIMRHIMKYLQANCPLNAFVGIMAPKRKHSFYKKYGFIVRPNETCGPGMTLVLTAAQQAEKT